MRILISKLPSSGFGSTLDMIDLQPLNYGELLKYSEHGSHDPLQDLIWDIDTFIRTIPQWEELSSFDVNVLVAYRKMLTLDISGRVKIGDEEIDFTKVNFSDIDRNILRIESVSLGGKEYKPVIRKMDEFYRTLCTYQASGVTDDKLAILGSYFSIDPTSLLSLTGGDIAVCEKLYPKIISHPTVELKGGGEVILVGKASQLFRRLLEVQGNVDSKIQLSPTVPL